MPPPKSSSKTSASAKCEHACPKSNYVAQPPPPQKPVKKK